MRAALRALPLAPALAGGLALAATATTAVARPPQAMACAVLAAPDGLPARLGDAVLAGAGVAPGVQTGQAALDELRALTERCAADQFLSPAQADAYFRYALGRLARDGLDARLAAQGVPGVLIDRALDIGPGNANNPASAVTQGDLNRVAGAITAAGREPAQVTPDGWRLITAWIVATATMFDGQRALD